MNYIEAEELTWCPSWSNSLWQGWSCGLVYCPGGNATDPIGRELISSDRISSWTPLKSQHSIPFGCLSSGDPVHVNHASAVKESDHQKFMSRFVLFWPSGEPPCFLWELCLLVSDPAVDPAFIASHQSIKNCRIWIDQLDHLPAVMATSFFLIFSEHPWDNLRTNIPHLQFLANNCVNSSHTDIKLCTYCLYRHTTVLIHEILYLANQL